MATSERESPTIPGTGALDSSPLPLENGDHLSREEFERRYDAMPELKKAELIEGVVYMGSPVSFRRHSGPHFRLISWLGYYQSGTPGVEGGDNGSLRLDLDNMPQPDVFLLILPEHGGCVRIAEDDIVEGGPELVLEVASSSASHDLHAKLEVYRRNGAGEYLVWRVRDRAFDWFVLRDGQYVRIEPSPDGTIHSEVFPGLWLDPRSLIRGDLSAVYEAVRRGFATPEHAAFVERLQAAPPPQ